MNKDFLAELIRTHIPAVVETAATRIKVDDLPKMKDIAGMLGKIDPETARDAAQASGFIAAIPTTGPGAEPPAAVFTAGPGAACPAVGVDGSQIYPSERDLVQWGAVICRAVDASGVIREMGKFLDETAIARFPGKFKALVDAERDALEAQMIADLAASPEHAQSLILMDGGLLPWSAMDTGFDEQSRRYNQAMAQAIQTGLIAGVVSMPRSRYLNNLLKAAFPNEAFPHFTDNALMTSHLGLGERSAVFMHGAGLSSGGVGQVYYFYLRAAHSEVMRVEIPAAIAFNTSAVERVHAALLANSDGLGYPAVLINAHNEVKISAQIAHQIQQYARMELVKKVGPDALPIFSVKQILKGESYG